MKKLALLLLLLLGASGAPDAQSVPTTQCVTTAVAGGTGDAITIPRLPCVPTTTLLVLTITAMNTTPTPTITPVGGVTQTIVAADGNAACSGGLTPGLRVLLTNNGTHWIALTQEALGCGTKANAFCPSIEQFGGVGNDSTDNTAAWNLAKATVSCIAFQAGKYFFASSISQTVPATGGFSVVGTGSGSTALRFAASAGLTLTYSGPVSAAHVSGLSILAGGTNSGTGIKLQQIGSVTSAANSVSSTVYDVTFRGSDGFAGTNCWASALDTTYVSYVNVIGSSFVGCSGPNGIGLNLSGSNTSAQAGVVYNVVSSAFTNLATGLLYGSNIQGVAVSGGSNFTGNTYGIYVPATSTGLAQLGVHGNAFGFNTIGVNQIGPVDVEIDGNLIYSSTSGNVGVSISTGSFTVANNTFNGTTQVGPTIGLRLGHDSGYGNGVVSGNEISNLGLGIQAATNGINFKIQNNDFTNNLTNITNASAARDISITGAGLAYATVSGATDNGSGVLRVTVGTTVGFINGMVVLVGGIGGIVGVGASQFVMAPIQVIDSNHIDLLTVTFAGAYTGGGILSTLP